MTPLLPALLLLQAAPPEETTPPVAPPGEAPAQDWEQDVPPVDPGIIEGRERPGYTAPLPEKIEQNNEGAVRAPPPQAFPTEQVPIPDRWRLIQSLGVVKERWLDPYHQNTYKGDRPINPEKVKWLPITGEDWFFVLNAISDTVVEPRTFPIPMPEAPAPTWCASTACRCGRTRRAIGAPRPR